MTPSAETYVGLLIQIPLVGIFVWFSLRIIDVFLKAMQELRASFILSMQERDREWRMFMEQERSADHEAIANMAGRFSDEIRTLGKEVGVMRGQMNGNGK